MKTSRISIIIISLILSVAAALALAACTVGPTPGTEPETTPLETPAETLPEKSTEELLDTLNGYLNGGEFNIKGDIEIINKSVGFTQTVAAKCTLMAKDLDKENAQVYVETTGIGADIYMTLIDGVAYMRMVQMGEEYKVKLTTDAEGIFDFLSVTMANMPTFAPSDFVSVNARTENGEYVLEAKGLTPEKFISITCQIDREDFESDEEYEQAIEGITFNNEEDYTLTVYYDKNGALTHYTEHMKMTSDGMTMTQNSNTYVVNEPVVITLPADADEYVEDPSSGEGGWWDQYEPDDELMISEEYAAVYASVKAQLTDLGDINVSFVYENKYEGFTSVTEGVYRIVGYGTDDMEFYQDIRGDDGIAETAVKAGDVVYYYCADTQEVVKEWWEYTEEDLVYVDGMLSELEYMADFNDYDFYSCTASKDADGNDVYTYTGLKRDAFAYYVLFEEKEYYETREEYEAALDEYEFDNTKDYSISYTLTADGQLIRIVESVKYDAVNSGVYTYEFSDETPVISAPEDADEYVNWDETDTPGEI